MPTSNWFKMARPNSDPLLNEIPCSIVEVADAAALAALPAAWAAASGGPYNPQDYIFLQVDTGTLYYYNGSSMVAFAGSSEVFGTGTPGNIACWTASNNLGDSPLAFDSTYINAFANIHLYSTNSIFGGGPSTWTRIVGIDSAYPPFTPTVRLGGVPTSTVIPTYIYGGEVYIASSLVPGPGSLTIDCDAGTILSQLSGTGSERALLIRDRQVIPVDYAAFYTADTGSPGGEVGLHLLNGADLYLMDSTDTNLLSHFQTTPSTAKEVLVSIIAVTDGIPYQLVLDGNPIDYTPGAGEVDTDIRAGLEDALSSSNPYLTFVDVGTNQFIVSVSDVTQTFDLITGDAKMTCIATDATIMGLGFYNSAVLNMNGKYIKNAYRIYGSPAYYGDKVGYLEFDDVHMGFRAGSSVVTGPGQIGFTFDTTQTGGVGGNFFVEMWREGIAGFELNPPTAGHTPPRMEIDSAFGSGKGFVFTPNGFAPSTSVGITMLVGAYSEIDMNSRPLIHVPNGAASDDAAAFGQIASALASYLPLHGGPMAGNIAMDGFKTTGNGVGTADGDVLTIAQVAGRIAVGV